MRVLSSKNRNTGIILSYCNTFIGMITGLFMSSFLLRQLGDVNYGVYQTMSSFANYLVLLEFGTGTVMTRNLLNCRNNHSPEETVKKNISTIWTIAIILSLLITIISTIFYFLIGKIYAGSLTPQQIVDGKRIFVFITIFLVASFLSQTINGIPLANENYVYSSSVSIVKTILRTGIIVALLVNFKYAIIIAIVDAILNLGIAFFGICFCKIKYKIKFNFSNFDKAVLKASLPLCLAMFLQTVVNQTNNTVGKFVLGVMTAPEMVSLYSVGLYVFSIFSSLTTIPVSLYMPQISKDIATGLEGKELTKTLIAPCRLIVLVGGSVLFGFIAVGQPFITIVYGEEYILAWAIAIILMAPMFLNMSNAVIINVLDIKNKRLARSVIMMISTTINVVLTIFLIKVWGVIGVAIATGIATLLQVLLLNIYYNKKINIKVMYLFLKSFKGILIYQILGAVAGFLLAYFINNTVMAFLAGGIVYVMCAFGGFLLFGKNAEEKEKIGKILNKLKRKKQV